MHFGKALCNQKSGCIIKSSSHLGIEKGCDFSEVQPVSEGKL